MKYGPHELAKLEQDLEDDYEEVDKNYRPSSPDERDSAVDKLNLLSGYNLLISRVKALRESLFERGYGK